jgi:hypothetical protein
MHGAFILGAVIFALSAMYFETKQKHDNARKSWRGAGISFAVALAVYTLDNSGLIK